MSFTIDTVGNIESGTIHLNTTGPSAVIKEFLKFKDQLFPNQKSSNQSLFDQNISSKILFGNGLEQETEQNSFNCSTNNSQKNTISLEVKNTLAKSIITSNFEQLHQIPSFKVGKRALQRERKKERLKSKGQKWYGMPKMEMTDEIQRDLEILQMRSVLNPKHFYKKNDMNVLPKYFQIGTVMDSSLDFYKNRLTKKERKKTLVDELLADAQFQKYNKRKYKEIIEEKQKTHYKAWRQARRNKKKK